MFGFGKKKQEQENLDLEFITMENALNDVSSENIFSNSYSAKQQSNEPQQKIKIDKDQVQKQLKKQIKFQKKEKESRKKEEKKRRVNPIQPSTPSPFLSKADEPLFTDVVNDKTIKARKVEVPLEEIAKNNQPNQSERKGMMIEEIIKQRESDPIELQIDKVIETTSISNRLMNRQPDTEKIQTLSIKRDRETAEVEEKMKKQQEIDFPKEINSQASKNEFSKAKPILKKLPEPASLETVGEQTSTEDREFLSSQADFHSPFSLQEQKELPSSKILKESEISPEPQIQSLNEQTEELEKPGLDELKQSQSLPTDNDLDQLHFATEQTEHPLERTTTKPEQTQLKPTPRTFAPKPKNFANRIPQESPALEKKVERSSPKNEKTYLSSELQQKEVPEKPNPAYQSSPIEHVYGTNKIHPESKFSKPLLFLAIFILLLTASGGIYYYFFVIKQSQNGWEPIKLPSVLDINNKDSKQKAEVKQNVQQIMDEVSSRSLSEINFQADILQLVTALKADSSKISKMENGIFIRPMTSKNTAYSTKQLLSSLNIKNEAVDLVSGDNVWLFLVLEKKNALLDESSVIKVNLLIELKKDMQNSEIVALLMDSEKQMPEKFLPLFVDEAKPSIPQIISFQRSFTQNDAAPQTRYFNYENGNGGKSIDWGVISMQNANFLLISTSKNSTQQFVNSL